MIFADIAEFLKTLGHGKRLLGLDIGERNIGVALSDERLVISSAYGTIKSKKFTADAEEIFDIINKHNIGGLVIGLPIGMDGKENAKCQSIRQFARNLLKINDIPIFFQDERLSTVSAEKALLEADLSRKKRAEVIDKTAATIILQSFLDRILSYRN